MTSSTGEAANARNRRSHPRHQMTIPVSLDTGKGRPLTVQNQDISWGGVRFVVPKEVLSDVESVTMTFPWTKGDSFSAAAEIVRTEDLDERHAVVAARFSSLSTADQRRLEKLLSMLQGGGDERRRHEALAPVLEVLFSDADEIRAKLAEVATGRLSVTVFEAYEAGQSIRLVLGGIADQPALRLRARVSGAQYLTTGTDAAWPMFNLQLQFEHPSHELKVAADTLLGRLPKACPARQQELEGALAFAED